MDRIGSIIYAQVGVVANFVLFPQYNRISTVAQWSQNYMQPGISFLPLSMVKDLGNDGS